MERLILSLAFLLSCCHFPAFSSTCAFDNVPMGAERPQTDTLQEYQILYNGREWKNLFYRVAGDQFLFSNNFLPASLSVQGRTFNNIRLKYDLYQDEIIIPFGPGKALQLNRELVEGFFITSQGKSYQFITMPEDGPEELKGYVRVLYSGKSALYVKYIKKINRPGIENHPDIFYQITRVYLVQDDLVRLIAGKGDLFNAFGEKRKLIRDFMKKNPMRISVKEPESLIPVIRFCDGL